MRDLLQKRSALQQLCPRLLILAAGVFFMSSAAQGGVFTNADGTFSVTNPVASVTLAWDTSTNPTVVGYHLYWGAASRTYTNYVTVTGTNAVTIKPLVRGAPNFFAVTALANSLESDFSNEVSYTSPTLPLPPGGTHVAYFTVQASGDLRGWCDVDNFGLPVDGEKDFFRLRIVAVSSP